MFADYDHVIALQPTHNVNCQRMSNNLNLLTEKKISSIQRFQNEFENTHKERIVVEPLRNETKIIHGRYFILRNVNFAFNIR